MNESEWLRLLLAVPATVVTTLGIVAWAFREKADAWVFRVLARNHAVWAQEAAKVEGFRPLFEAGAILPEVREMREAMDRRLSEVARIPEELSRINVNVEHFARSVDLLREQIKGWPERLAVIEAVVEERVVGGRRRRDP